MEINKNIKIAGIGLCFTILVGGAIALATQSNTEYITAEKAKSIALKHAGILESEATFFLSELDYDDGVAEYEVEFWNGSTEYDYEINAITGEIIGYDYDTESYSPPKTPQVSTSEADIAVEVITPATNATEYITEEKAKSIALNDAGVSINDAKYLECEFDFDDGRAEYEIEWEVGRMEYEYTINAVDGVVLERDVEYDD